MMKLYQFQFSHFCEKARWALDYKGLAYTPENLLPGLHLRVTRKLAPKSCLPILVDRETVVQDSDAIITYLDEKYPDRPLNPRGSQAAKAALEWERYLDAEIGVPLRLWFYHHALPDRARALAFLLDGAPWYERPLFALMFPKVRPAMMQAMGINADSARQAEARLRAALERLDGAVQQGGFLVGDRFSRADLTACALLAPFCAPGKSDAAMSAALPPPIRDFRDREKSRPYFRWVLDTYRTSRRPAPAGG